jgi:uncharacterized protein (TIGR04222 family)
MPNPFDLHGPAFLLFYAIFGALAVGILLLRQRFREAEAAPPRGALSDPHLIAFLRGGEKEAVSLAAIALRHRGLLDADDMWLSTTPRAQVERVDAPLDKALLAYFPSDSGGRIEGAMEDPAVRDALREIENTLEERGLLPNGAERDARAVGLLVAVAALWMMAIGRVLTRDPRYGIGFTVLLAIAFTACAAYGTFRRRTTAGDRLLADLRALFDSHRSAAFLKVDGSTTAPPLLAAVYGATVLSGADGWLLERIHSRPPQKKADGESSGGCGSGGGSSSAVCGDGGSGDGGSGCGGGGGCGGGCGGCGGCGG